MTVLALDSAKPRAICETDEIMASRTAGWTLQDETDWLSEATIMIVEVIMQETASRIAATASQGVFHQPGRQDCKDTG